MERDESRFEKIIFSGKDPRSDGLLHNIHDINFKPTMEISTAFSVRDKFSKDH